ncbi:TPA: hypothetical protein JAX37_003316 [Enterobacter cloacae]|nr:hypothetical protein [Enterobacter cloacae]
MKNIQLGQKMEIWNFINNSWFVGIVGGILSGLATTWIGRKIFSEKDKKEYISKVNATNREIVFSLRSAISDNIHHDHKIIRSLMAATARKNGVLLSDIYSIKEVTEDLIKEVMDSSFIPSEYKKKYCEGLTRTYLTEDLNKKREALSQELKDSLLLYSSRRESIITTSTALLGIMVTVLTFLLTIIQSKSAILERIDNIIFPSLQRSEGMIFLLTAPIVAALSAMMLLYLKRIILSKQRDREIERERQRILHSSEFAKARFYRDLKRNHNLDNENENEKNNEDKNQP